VTLFGHRVGAHDSDPSFRNDFSSPREDLPSFEPIGAASSWKKLAKSYVDGLIR
jgi:hypothetical protein